MGEWKTGKPEKSGRYIVTLEGSVMECDWTGKRWHHPNQPALTFDEVTAWMPMPAPYLQSEK